MGEQRHARPDPPPQRPRTVHPTGLLAADLPPPLQALRVHELSSMGDTQRLDQAYPEKAMPGRPQIEPPLAGLEAGTDIDEVHLLAGTYVQSPGLC